MSKIYLLLRNNLQNGPLSIEELVAQELKPTDLIWVEGRSAGWSNPSEIESLKPFIAATTHTSSSPTPYSFQPTTEASKTEEPKPSKKIFVSLPDSIRLKQDTPASATPADLEKKAEALRKRAEAFAGQKLASLNEPSLQTNYSRTVDEVEEDFTGWFYQRSQQKKKEAKKRKQILAGVVIALAAGGFLISQSFFPNKKDLVVANTVSNPTVPAQQNELTQTKPLPTEAEVITIDEKPGTEATIQPLTKPKPEKKAVPSPSLSITESSGNEQATSNPDNENAKAVYTKPEATQESNESASSTPEKKKGLKGLFDKLKNKKKDEQPVEEETVARTTTNERGERVGQKRGNSGSGEAVTIPEISLSQIELKSTQKTAEWMMGIVNQKVKLTNKSSHTIETAIVEVIYYGEENNVIEKKKLSFSNISPKRSQTLPVPDHRMAMKADYKVVSAEAKQDGFVHN